VEFPGAPRYAVVAGLGGHSRFPDREPAGGEDFERGEEDLEGGRKAPTEAPADPSVGDQDRSDREPAAGAARVGRGTPAYEQFPLSEELFLVPDHAQT
jgi:hypothetical protein